MGGEQLARENRGSHHRKERLIETGQSQPSVVFSPDSKWLVTGGYGTTAFMWDPATGKKTREFETDRDGGLTPVFSRDGKLLAVGNRNSVPRLLIPRPVNCFTCCKER